MNVVDKFDSFGEMLAYAKNAPEGYEARKGSQWFCETESLDEAVKLAEEGWHDERPEVDKLIRALQDQLGERLHKTNRHFVGFAGGGVNMGNFLAGLPNHMNAFRRVPMAKHGKIVRIVLDYGANGMVRTEVMRKRGAVVTVLVDALATLGLSVELWGETTVKIGDLGKHTTLVKLHDPREPLDIDSLMYVIAHPSMLRRLTFGVRELSAFGADAVQRKGHGTSVPITLANELEADIVINRTEHGGDPRVVGKDPVAWVMETIQGLGVL